MTCGHPISSVRQRGRDGVLRCTKCRDKHNTIAKLKKRKAKRAENRQHIPVCGHDNPSMHKCADGLRRCLKCLEKWKRVLYLRRLKFTWSTCGHDGATALCRDGIKRCPACMKKRLAHQMKSNLFKDRYGVNMEWYRIQLTKQGGTCAICRKPETCVDHRTKRPRMLAVDHNHRTRKSRGLLCRRCNNVLGLMREDESLFLEAVKYLQSYRTASAAA